MAEENEFTKGLSQIRDNLQKFGAIPEGPASEQPLPSKISSSDQLNVEVQVEPPSPPQVPKWVTEPAPQPYTPTVSEARQNIDSVRRRHYSPAVNPKDIGHDEDVMTPEQRENETRLWANVNRFEDYLTRNLEIEAKIARLQKRVEDIAKGSEEIAGQLQTTPSEQNKNALASAQTDLEEYKTKNVPAELLGKEPITFGTTLSKAEETYKDNVQIWVDAAKAEQTRAQAAIAEQNKPQAQKDAERKLKETQAELDEARAKQREAEELAKKATAMVGESLQKIEGIQKERDAAVKNVADLREQAANGDLPEIQTANARAAAAERRAQDAEKELAELKAKYLEPETPPEQLRPEQQVKGPESRWEKIQKFTINSLKNWVRNLDWRDKNADWKIGVVGGLAETAVVNILPIPGGRLVVNACNAVAAQGIYVISESLRANEVYEANRTAGLTQDEIIDKILSTNDKYIHAQGRMTNLFLGLSAGMTYGSLLTMGAELLRMGGEAYMVLRTRETPPLPNSYKPPVGTVEAPRVEGPGDVLQQPIKPPIPPNVETGPLVKETFMNVTVPESGNFWTTFRSSLGSIPEWADLTNGTKHSDVLTDMVVKMARANNWDLGNISPGSIELSRVLTPEQLALLKKAAEAKTYAEYLKIRPEYLKIIGR